MWAIHRDTARLKAGLRFNIAATKLHRAREFYQEERLIEKQRCSAFRPGDLRISTVLPEYDLESNVGNPALCLSVSQPYQVAPTSGTCGPFGENGIYTRANGQVINGTRSPLGNAFGSNSYFMTIGNSNYNSLQVSVRHRTGPLELMLGYTWSKSIDDSSGWGDQIKPLNQRLGRSLSVLRCTAKPRFQLPL